MADIYENLLYIEHNAKCFYVLTLFILMSILWNCIISPCVIDEDGE